MKISSKLISRITPKLNKSELMLSIILMDLCKEHECKIGKAAFYNHPLMTTTLKLSLPHVISGIVNKKIICDTYYDNAEEKYVLFEEIKRNGVVFKVKFNENTFNNLNDSEMVLVDSQLFKTFTALSEIRFVMWVMSWVHSETARLIDNILLKTYLNKQKIRGEFITNHLYPIIKKCNKFGINLIVEKINDENDKRYIKSLVFKKG